ncbi:class A beta-lactamase [Spirillospora sp. CA-108201]
MTTHSIRDRRLGAAALALTTIAGLAGCGSGADPDVRSAAPRGAASTIAVDPAQAKVTRQIGRLEATRHARIGAFALDTGTGRTVSHRPDERFAFASTFKAMACGAVLRKARRSDPGLLDRVIHYTKDDLVEYSPVTEKHVDTGMTVADLCHAAITQSDNTAGNLVLRRIGGPAGLTAFFRSLGDTVSRGDRWETDLNVWKPGEPRDTTAPRPWAGNLRALTTGGALVPADRRRLVGWMKATVTGDRRIRAGLPENWTVGDKTGTGGTYGTANDIAIAWPPSGAPLVIVITTNRLTPEAEADDGAVAQTTRILAGALR